MQYVESTSTPIKFDVVSTLCAYWVEAPEQSTSDKMVNSVFILGTYFSVINFLHLFADILRTLHICDGHVEDATFWKCSDIFQKI
jgi:hypothetical protein